MKRTGLAGLLLVVLAVPVAHADVTVRVEGADATVAIATVAGTGPDVTKAGATCAGSSGAGALDRAVAGDWAADNFGGADPLFVNTIKGQNITYTGANPRFWSFTHGNTFSNEGICGYTPTAGDELLFYPRCDGPTATGCFDGLPLDVTAPAAATTGVPFTVTVRQFDDSKDPAVASPVAGVSVGGSTTGADGSAQVTVTQAGTTTLTATKGRQVRDEATVAVSDPPTPGASPAPAPAPPATPAVAADTRPPYSAVLGIREQQRFTRSAPRTLRAAVDESVSAVTLGLTRQVGRRCSAFNDARAAFVRTKCKRHPRFAVGTDAQVSYLLPKRLGPGRYVLDVVATDVAGNQEQLARGRNRVVFTVR